MLTMDKPAQGGASKDSEFNLSSLQILIVEDSMSMRLLIKQILRGLGITQVREAPEGAAALEMLKNFTADIIITDLKMSPIDGIEFVQMLRTAKDSPNPFCPVIMLTGHTEYENVVEARNVGVNELLAKPISADRLLSRIKRILKNPPNIQRDSS